MKDYNAEDPAVTKEWERAKRETMQPNAAVTEEWERGWIAGYRQALDDFQRWERKKRRQLQDAQPKSTQGPDHELQPTEPASDILENRGRAPMTMRERLRRFATRDPWEPYTGADE